MIERHHIKRMEVYLVILVALLPLLIQNEAFRHLLVIAGIYGIAALGLSLFMGFAGQISIGHSAFMGIGGYTTAVLVTRFGVPPATAVATGALAAGAVALLTGAPLMKLREYFLALATIGLIQIFRVVVSESGSLTGGVSGISDIPWFSLFGLAFDTPLRQFFLVWGILYVLFLFSRNLVRSKHGRAALAVSSSEDTARVTGIEPSFLKLQFFALSAVFAGLAGGLFAGVITAVNPSTFNLSLSVLLVMMVIIGGVGSLSGAVSGAVVLTWITNALNAYQEYSLPVFGLILILFLVFLPEGIFRGIGLRWFNAVRTWADDDWRKELDR